jgi:hypothetical protein
LSGIIAAAYAIIFLSLAFVSTILVYSFVGSAFILFWVLALVSQDADLTDNGIN